MSVIPKGSTVLVTGVSGYIASHIALQLLNAGYKVRGTSRSATNAKDLTEYFHKRFGGDYFEVYEVPDMIQDGAFDAAVQNVSGICHVASIVTFSDKVDEVIPPTVKGTLNILKSASKSPSVKSVVYTSSSTAALMPQPDKHIVVTKETWNEDVLHAVYNNPSPSAYEVYGASKTEAEKAFWQATRESNPPFQCATVLPNANFGPSLAPDAAPQSTGAMLMGLFSNGDKTLFHLGAQWFVNVNDTAKLHVAALTDPSCNGQRVFAYAAPYNGNDLLRIMREQNPGRGFIDDVEGTGRDLTEVPNQDAEALLRKHYGHGWVSLEESIRETTTGVVG